MKKLFVILFAVILTAGMTLGVSAGVSEAIEEGGFEDSVGLVFANGGHSDLSQTQKVYYNGGASLYVTLRQDQWGGPAWDVTDYISGHGDGEFYCTFAILGTFEGSVRATLHTTYSDGRDYYRQVGSLTSFKNNEWTLIGYDEEGKPLPLRIENWDEADITKWDPVTTSADLSSATLYFWIEGDNLGDLYMDNMNFWGAGDTPVDYTANGANTTPKVLEFSLDGSDTTFGLIDDETEETKPVTNGQTNSPDASDSNVQTKPVSGDDKDKDGINPLFIVIPLVVIAVVAVVIVVSVKKKKK